MFPIRSSTRLRGFDYGQSAAYFITLCVDGRPAILGQLHHGEVLLSPAGEIVREEWTNTPLVRPGIHLDEWVIMPDHFQALVFIDEDRHRPPGGVGAHRSAPGPSIRFQRPARTIGSFIAQFKSRTTTRINIIRGTPSARVWQRGCHDRIIRNEVELDNVRSYIRKNPKQG
jgi:REP element-mobilizing transposase RayT